MGEDEKVVLIITESGTNIIGIQKYEDGDCIVLTRPLVMLAGMIRPLCEIPMPDENEFMFIRENIVKHISDCNLDKLFEEVWMQIKAQRSGLSLHKGHGHTH